MNKSLRCFHRCYVCAEVPVMFIEKQFRHTLTALLRPNFGSGACEFEHIPQKTPPQHRQ